MISGKWLVPGLVFLAGAVFGRVFGVKPLMRGAMAAATVSGMVPNATASRGRPRKIAHRPARKRSAQKRSARAA